MKNSTDQTERFDSLRAGLRVEDVDFKDAYTPKIIDQQNAYWQRVVETMDESVDGNRALGNQLRIRRRQVLSGEYTPVPRSRGLPRFAVGIAAGVALFAVVTTWWEPAPTAPAPATTRTASLETAESGTVAMTQTVSLDTTDADHVDFANNVDFYSWLEGQSDRVADASD